MPKIRITSEKGTDRDLQFTLEDGTRLTGVNHLEFEPISAGSGPIRAKIGVLFPTLDILAEANIFLHDPREVYWEKRVEQLEKELRDMTNKWMDLKYGPVPQPVAYKIQHESGDELDPSCYTPMRKTPRPEDIKWEWEEVAGKEGAPKELDIRLIKQPLAVCTPKRGHEWDLVIFTIPIMEGVPQTYRIYRVETGVSVKSLKRRVKAMTREDNPAYPSWRFEIRPRNKQSSFKWVCEYTFHLSCWRLKWEMKTIDT
jgi:hypothetical protein